jgi:hypothetical protein
MAAGAARHHRLSSGTEIKRLVLRLAGSAQRARYRRWWRERLAESDLGPSCAGAGNTPQRRGMALRALRNDTSVTAIPEQPLTESNRPLECYSLL